MEDDSLTEKTIGVCIDVHNELSTGFVEKVYEASNIDRGPLVNFATPRIEIGRSENRRR